MIYRLLRGGAFSYVTCDLRTSNRGGSQPVFRIPVVGFRLIVRGQA